MKKLFNLFLCLFLMLLIAHKSDAQEYKVLVLPDNIQFDSTNYFVYPDASTMFASDTINEIKKDGRIQTVSMTEVRETLRKNTKLKILTKNALKEFKYNYNVPFVDFKLIAHNFSTNKVLIITSQTDVQNFFLRRTLWDFLNIPGASVIDPAYKMSTYVVLFDVDEEKVLWQHNFYKKLAKVETRIIAQNFAPATEQLEEIRAYSQYRLSPKIAKMVKFNIIPAMEPEKQKDIVNVSTQKSPEVINNVINNIQEIEFKPNITAPKRPEKNNFGEMIYDL